MGAEENVQVVKDGYAPLSRGDIPSLLALLTEDVEWHHPDAGYSLAGTYHGHRGVAPVARSQPTTRTRSLSATNSRTWKSKMSKS